jgi:hypothetical protein
MAFRLCSCFLLLCMSCGPSGLPENPSGSKPTSKSKSLPTSEPLWVSFALPISKVTLPLFLVGEHKVPSSGCWKPGAPDEVDSAIQATWTTEREKALALSVKAKFSKYLIEAGLDASFANGFTDTWTIEAEGLSISRTDPVKALPDFNNAACTEKALKWFDSERLVVTEAVRAKSFKVKMGTEMSSDAKAKLELAIQQIGIDFQTEFKNSDGSAQEHELIAKDAYVGARGTKLVANRCELTSAFEVKADTTLSLCDGQYSINVRPSQVGDRYTLSITPSGGNTAAFDDAFGMARVHAMGENRIASALIERSGDKLTIRTLNILLVGASG